MAYEFTTEEKHGYLRVEVFGERIPGEALEDIKFVWSRVTETMRSKGVSNLLAILHLTGNVSTIGAYNLVLSADDFGWTRYLHVALVATNHETLQGNLFAETVAVNRGYQMKVFDNELEAHDWLHSFNSINHMVENLPPVDLG